MSREISISINNWDKYNPRRDLKSMPWIRLQGDIAFSESLFGLDAEAKWLWIFLLSYSTKKMSGDFSINEKYLSHHSGVSASKFSKYLDAFLSTGLLAIKTSTSRITNESVRITNGSVPYERTNERTNEHTCQSELAFGETYDAVCEEKNSAKGEAPSFERKAAQIAVVWNDMAEQFNLPKVKLPLSKDRLKKLKEPLNEFTEASEWVDIIFTVPDNDFNLGVNDRKWKANFDWLLHTTKFNYRKLWEARIVENI